MSRIQRLIRPNQHALSWKMALPIVGLTAVCLTVYAHDSAQAPVTAASGMVTASCNTSPAVAAPAIAAAAAESAPACRRSSDGPSAVSSGCIGDCIDRQRDSGVRVVHAAS